MTSTAAGSGRYPVTRVLSCFLVVFLVLFPKGGVKVGEIPLTWGYMALAVSFVPLALYRLLVLRWRVRAASLAAVTSLVPLNLVFFYAWQQFGIGAFGAVVSNFTGLVVLPIAFLLVYPAFLDRVDGVEFARWLRFSIVCAALFGIFLFFQYPLTGHLLEIPLLTVNAQDYGLIERTKHINRGFFLKLISTYNNGNVYGVATLILLPLFDALEPKRWKRNVVKLALVLTLSRTVWFGLVADQLFSLVPIAFSAARTFPRLSLKPILRRGLVTLLTVALIGFGLLLSSASLTFLFDPNLGGRVGWLGALANPHWLPSSPLGPFSEIVYASAVDLDGIVGGLSVLLVFGSPLLLYVADHRRLAKSPLRRAAFKGLMLYAFLCVSDGAIELIPVLAFYWFAYMVFLEGWPGGLEIVSTRSASLTRQGSGSRSFVPPLPAFGGYGNANTMGYSHAGER